MPSRIPPRRLGQQGETLAERELTDRGFAILGRNIRLKGVEFDVVARRGDEIWFVEVKTRSDTRGGFPYEAIGDAKLERMESGALEFLENHRIGEVDYRFVAASIVVDGRAGSPAIEWLPLL